ncbi:MAG: nitrate/nitrite transporter NrtS [Methylococcales bacterium]
MNTLISWLQCAFQRDVMMCSGKLAILVGTVLMLINYGDKLYLGHIQFIDWIKIGLTYLVPYFVSTYSTVEAFRTRNKKTKNKLKLMSYDDFLVIMQQQCNQKQGNSCLVFIEINNATQVARLLQGFWAERKLISMIEKIILKHAFDSGCSYSTKLNHHLFALILEYPVQESIDIAELLAKNLDQKSIKINASKNKNTAKTYYPKLTIGLTPLAPVYNKPELAITAAEEALYQARNVGNSIVKVVQPDNQSLHQYFDSLHSLPLLRVGLIEKHFILYAQPIVSAIPQKSANKAEILLRYKDPNGRVFPPSKFLKTAELFNVSRELDLYVIENFCRFIQLHPTNTLYSINISGSTVRYPLIFDSIKNLFKQYNVNPKQVCFEITENVADKDYEQASQLMFKLKHELGCQLSLDDIGIGSSNLANLSNFHVDNLKIDGYFVQQMLSEPYSEQVIRFIISSAKLLNKKTIAEYVEHAEQQKKLHELGVDYFQGYLTGRPELLFDPKKDY